MRTVNETICSRLHPHRNTNVRSLLPRPAAHYIFIIVSLATKLPIDQHFSDGSWCWRGIFRPTNWNSYASNRIIIRRGDKKNKKISEVEKLIVHVRKDNFFRPRLCWWIWNNRAEWVEFIVDLHSSVFCWEQQTEKLRNIYK